MIKYIEHDKSKNRFALFVFLNLRFEKNKELNCHHSIVRSTELGLFFHSEGLPTTFLSRRHLFKFYALIFQHKRK
jgi:hypothetical protein